MSFDSGEGTPAVLDAFARKVAGKTGEKGALPPLLSVFPRDGIIANSEKYILRNVMGFEFLRNGYMASYKLDGKEFECFIIEADKGRDPAALLKQLLDFYAKRAARRGHPSRPSRPEQIRPEPVYRGCRKVLVRGESAAGRGRDDRRPVSTIPGRVAERAYLRGDPRTVAGVADLETKDGAVPIRDSRAASRGDGSWRRCVFSRECDKY